MNHQSLCPFSKPLIGNWCQCPYAQLAERCSGKLQCTRQAEYRSTCVELVESFKAQSRFILQKRTGDSEFTHSQLMKIRCGGLLGMQRVLGLDRSMQDRSIPPSVRHVMAAAEIAYGDLSAFPFNEIVQDIKAFKHRKPRRVKV